MIFVLIAPLSAFSQPGLPQSEYPKTIIHQGRTVIAITPAQLKEINATHIKAVRYEQISDSLQAGLNNCMELYNVGQELIASKDSIIHEQSLVIKRTGKQAEEYKGLWEGTKKQVQSAKIWGGIGGGVAGAIIIGLLVGFLTK